MNNQRYQKQIVELDLKELLWDLLAQWKAILVVSLVVALIVCGCKYAKDKSAYSVEVNAQKEAEEQKSISKDERIAIAISALPEKERDAVKLAVEQSVWINNQKEYLQKSILLNENPANQRVLDLRYYVETGSDASATPLIYGYSGHLTDQKTVDALRNVLGEDLEDRYIKELINCTKISDSGISEDDEKGVFGVSIVLPADADAVAVETVITNSLQEYKATLSDRIIAHNLSIISSSEGSFFDDGTAARKNNLLNNIYAMQNVLKNNENSFSAEQKAAFESITLILNEIDEESVLDSIDSAKGEAKVQSDDELVAPGISAKYAILGFIFGMFLYAFCYVLYIISKGCVSSAFGIESYTGARLIGNVYYKREHKGLEKILHSNFVNRLRYKNLPGLDVQLAKIEKSIEAVCAHVNARSLTIIGMTDLNAKNSVGNAFTTISSALDEKGIESSILNTTSELEEKDLLNVGKAILLVGDDTKISHIRKVAALCHDYDINLLGSIYFGEM